MTDEEYIADDDRLEPMYPPSREYNITINKVYGGDDTYYYEAEIAEWESAAGGIVIGTSAAKTAREAAIKCVTEAIGDFDD